MRSKARFISALVLLVFLTGCASIISKSMYPVTVSSIPTGATISITNEDGKEIYKGTSPATITLESGRAYFDARQYTVTFSKTGYEKQTAIIKPRIDGWYFANILLGGAIGMLIVDPLTGAMWTLPSDLTVTLSEKVAWNETEQFLKIVTIDQLSDPLKKKLIRIN